MMEKKSGFASTILWFLASSCVLSVAGTRQTAQEAKQILDVAAVKGGLIVHVGCSSGNLTAALRINDSYLVHGLDNSVDAIKRAREHIRSLGLYGKVSVERWARQQLPYVDNLVNLLVIEEPDRVAAEEMQRVLAPGGVACVRRDGRWETIHKSWPEEIDEWTHFLHDATGNAVSHDSIVGPPGRIQWVSGPSWARSHEHLPTVSAMVSARGRIFYIVDEGPTASVILPSRWFLIARDAFNGTLLWKKPIEDWANHLMWFRCMPFQLVRRLVSIENRVFVTLGFEDPVSALDAATGELLHTYEDTSCTEEIIYAAGKLIVLKSRAAKVYPYLPHRDKVMAEWKKAGQYGVHRPELLSGPRLESVMAIDIKTGEVLWEKQADNVFPRTLASDGTYVFFREGQEIVCVDLETGRQQWCTAKLARTIPDKPWMVAATLVAHKGVLLYADTYPDGKIVLTALSAEDGGILWSDETPHAFDTPVAPHHLPVDLFVADNLVWTGLLRSPKWKAAFRIGRDPLTGEVKRRLDIQWDPRRINMGHHRCYRNKATNRYLLTGSDGVEFVDLRSGEVRVNNWVRGTCNYGIMPCNGLLYAPPHSCACNLHIRLSGMLALAAKSKEANHDGTDQSDKLERGPAYGHECESNGPHASDKASWPTYRHDSSRSGATVSAVSPKLERTWQAEIGGRLSSTTIAGGFVYVAEVDAHTVHALNAASGEPRWTYTACGRVDSPPTIHEGRAIFGSADGWVYCLRARDGKLIWRFRAAPGEQRVGAFGQLESAWPVHGSVLVQEDPSAPSGAAAYFVAGRSPFLNGGIRLYRLDVDSGRELASTAVTPPKTWQSGRELLSACGQPDILSSRKKCIYMRHLAFDAERLTREKADLHLLSTNGFLDASWWHRSYWLYGIGFSAGWGGWPNAGNRAPSGRILVFDDDFVYGFGRNFYPRGSTVQWSRGEHYVLFATKKPQTVAELRAGSGGKHQGKGPDNQFVVPCRWCKRPPLLARAMVLAGQTIFFAGPPKVPDTQPDALEVFEGDKGALLWAVSTTDGKKLAEYKLASPPVFDGITAAGGRLYISTKDGRLLCMAPNK